jgi:DNA repair protein RadC
MKNVKISVEGETVTIVIDLKQRQGLSRRLPTMAFEGLGAEVGLSPTQAERLQVIFELTQRFAKGDPGECVRITSASDAVRLLRPMLAHLDHEEFRCLFLMRVITWLRIPYCIWGPSMRPVSVHRRYFVRRLSKGASGPQSSK